MTEFYHYSREFLNKGYVGCSELVTKAQVLQWSKRGKGARKNFLRSWANDECIADIER